MKSSAEKHGIIVQVSTHCSWARTYISTQNPYPPTSSACTNPPMAPAGSGAATARYPCLPRNALSGGSPPRPLHARRILAMRMPEAPRT